MARSPAMRKLVEMLDRLRGTDLPVLIRGETGTGKELVARILHEEGRRAGGPFLVVDCAAIPESLFEAELFGARAGAFTGIEEDRQGLLAAADGGTILFDEIAGATPGMQAKLLRVLEGRTFRPVGSEEERRVDVRFLFTSARDLEREVREGRLSRDLYHRMGAIVLAVPPLRDRPEDFEDLVRSILAERASPPPELEPKALEVLRRLEWPGNVRELANFLERLSIESSGPITAERVEAARREPRTATLFPRNILAGESLERLQEMLERDYIAHHFRRLGRDTAALARFLGCTRRHLYRRCARLGISLRKL